MDHACSDDTSRANHPLSICITQEQVWQALDTLRYSPHNQHLSELTRLFLVDRLLANPDLPHSPTNRVYALQTILVELIRHQLALHRQVVGLCAPPPNEPLADALLSIQADAQVDNPELTGWSWLYYHYARSDLDLSPALFSQSAHVELRTLRRYQRHAITRLTGRLIHQESEARYAHRQRRLSGLLPIPAPTRLFGREMEMQWVQGLLQAEPPLHFQVNGAKGIGKSAFVQETVRQQIDAGGVDYLIWIENPLSMQNIHQHLAQVLSLKAASLTLRDYAANYQLVMVLDGLDGLQKELADLENLLDDLSTEVVYLVNRSYMPLRHVDSYIRLRELNFIAVSSFVCSLVARLGHGDVWGHPDEVVSAIWQQAGGNPSAIRSAVQELYRMKSLN